MAHKDNDRIKISGYAQRIFFNNGIEYRDFSDELVGNQITSAGGVPLFTMGNFSVTTNLDPKPNRVFTQGSFSEFFTLDSISEEDGSVINIEKNIKTQLNLDLTNPLHYVWYGSFVEYNRVSLEDISDRWSAAIYVDNKVGSVTGDSVTNFIYDGIEDTSTFKVNSKYFFNPFKIKYTTDDALVVEEEEVSNLRNLIINHTSYRIEFSGRSYDIIDLTGSTQVTNSEITIKTKGNAFVNLTDINGGVLDTTGSFQYFIKPKESKIEEFFSSLNEYQRNILNRNTYPIYKTTFSYPEETTEGIIVYKEQTINFPISKDGYNLNFFDGLYISYLDRLNEVAELFDKGQTNLMVRKYTAEIINSFDTAPRCDGDDLVNNGAKATNLLHIYGREFDEIKKYGNGIKYAHVVTYNKRDNVPDVLTKDLAHMLGFEQIDLLNKFNLVGTLLPSNGEGQFSGTSKNYTKKEIETEVYRRLILNIAWLWKSKGTRKAIEFLFRFMGAPESVVVFDEHLYVADKPIDVEAVKRLLYLYTGDVDISKLPFDEDGYPLPPLNSDEMYFQKAGGWYRETGGDNAHIHTSIGNNPHAGPYDGGTEYIAQFESNCFIPGFSAVTEFTVTGNTLHENLFLNYNNGFINGMPSDFDLYGVPLASTNNQLLNSCVELNVTAEQCPPLSAGTTLFRDLCMTAKEEYISWTNKIKKDDYKKYDPEWYRVQRNFEIANQQFAQELVSVGCDDNQCLAICADFINSVEGDACDNYKMVQDSHFIYFTNEDGKKVLFDDFPSCCVSYGGIYKDFKDPGGREACYCASSAPCNGKPIDMTDDGIIIFEMGGGNVFVDYQQGDSLTPSQAESLLDTYNGNGSFYEGYDGWTVLSVRCVLAPADSNIPSGCFELDLVNYENNQYESVRVIKPNGSTELGNITTQVSSPECCTWHNYDYTIKVIGDKNVISCFNPNPLKLTAISMISTTGKIKEELASLNSKLLESVEAVRAEECDYLKAVQLVEQKTIQNQTKVFEEKLSAAEKKISTPYLPETTAGYSEYTPYSNSATADITEFESITIFEQSKNNSIYYKYTSSDITGTNSIDFGSAFNDSDLMDCTVWSPDVDKSGLVSFSVTDFEGDTTTITHNTSKEEGANLYRECCIAKGYQFGTFKSINQAATGRVTSTNPVKLIPSEPGAGSFSSCVDPEFIQCGDVDAIKMVLSSDQWNGFYLPEDAGGVCEVDIMLDVMVRYNADKLLGCALENNCGIPYVNVNSVYDPGCPNFIVFSDRDILIKRLKKVKSIEDINQVSQEIIENYPSLTDETTNQFINYYDTNAIEVWQTPGLQIEPSQECCETGYGGQMLTPEQMIGHVSEVSYSSINGLKTNFLPKSSPLNNFIGTFNEIDNESKQIIKDINEQNCIEFDNFESNGCDFDYSELFTTKDVCYITPPPECFIYSTLLRDYWKSLNQLYLIRDVADKCKNDYDTISKSILECEKQIKELLGNNTKVLQSGKKTEKLEKARRGKSVTKNEKVEIEINALTTENAKLSKQTDVHSNIAMRVNFQKIEHLKVQKSEQLTKQASDDVAYGDKKDQLDWWRKSNWRCLWKLRKDCENKKRIQAGLSCCIDLQEKVNESIDKLLNNRVDVVKGAIDCYAEWEHKLHEDYNKYLSSKAENVIKFMDETEICVTLEVDNSLGVKNNNRITKYTTLNSYTKAINPVWKWEPAEGGYSGIVLDGTDNAVTIVESSVGAALMEDDIDVSPDLFEPYWKPIKFSISDTECENLKRCYPGKQFFIGLTIKNYECDTCLLVDNIQINVNVDEITRVYSPEACPSFDLKCVVDDKRSWVFSDGGVTETVDLRDVVNCEVIENSRTITTFGNKDERLWTDLEYRYTEYDVNHSKLVVNSKETSFRIDPANAIECDVYGFWQEIDCAECDTLGTCDAGSPLVWTGATGQSVTLTGTTCTDYDCDDLILTLRILAKNWGRKIYHATGNHNFAKNASVSAMKYGGKATNVKHLNGKTDPFKSGPIRYLPVNMGIGFDTQTNECGTDIIEINRGNDEYSLISEELDGTLGFYSYTGETGPLCDFTPLVDAQCCNRMSQIITTKKRGRYGFNLSDKDYVWDTTRNACVWGDLPAITGKCDSDCSYYGSSKNLTKELVSTLGNIEVSGTCLENGLPSDVDIFVFYDSTSNNAANIRIQSAHVYRWWVHYVNGGLLSNIGPGDNYTGKLRQYQVAPHRKQGMAEGERWLGWSTFPWYGRYLNPSDGSGEVHTQQGFNEDADWDGGSVYYDEVYDKAIVDYLYEKTPDGRYFDPITGYISTATNPTQALGDPKLITEVPGVVREDVQKPIAAIGKDVWIGGIAPDYIENNMFDLSGNGGLFKTEFRYSDYVSSESGKTNVFVITMMDEVAYHYHDNHTPTGSITDYNHDGTENGDTVQPTSEYTRDFNKFIDVYQNNYKYFRGYAYTTFGSTAANIKYPYQSAFALSLYAAVEGEVVPINDFKDVATGWPGTLSAITYTNPYSALTATTLFNENKAGLKNFGWAEEHQVGFGKDLKPDQLPQDIKVLIEGTPVPTICVTAGTSGSTIYSAVCSDTNICVKPLEYLETDPDNVNIKVKFDEMVLSNLIDAKSRQVISGYPMLQLFYHLYLTAKRCGRTLTNRLDNDDLFEMMDLIGDYWTDIIEQVVPATTIWDGCKNSGKVYRNTVFDQPKFPYRRTVLNYYDSECPTDQISNEIIASEVGLCIEVEDSWCRGNCGDEEVQSCKSDVDGMNSRVIFLLGDGGDKIGKIAELDNIINSTTLFEFTEQDVTISPDECLYTQQQKDEFIRQRDGYQIELDALLIDKESKMSECEALSKRKEELKDQAAKLKSNCSTKSDNLKTAEDNLSNYNEGSLDYEKQRSFIALLRSKYETCVRKSQVDKSTYNTIFITQMYDSNEYEGNVKVYGDPEWEKEIQLIHSCDEVVAKS